MLPFLCCLLPKFHALIRFLAHCISAFSIALMTGMNWFGSWLLEFLHMTVPSQQQGLFLLYNKLDMFTNYVRIQIRFKFDLFKTLKMKCKRPVHCRLCVPVPTRYLNHYQWAVEQVMPDFLLLSVSQSEYLPSKMMQTLVEAFPSAGGFIQCDACIANKK